MHDIILKQIAQSLDRAQVPYMVIDGQAVLLHGVPRFTMDIDLTLGIDAPEWRKIVAELHPLGLEPLGERDALDAFVRRTRVLRCQVRATLLPLDLSFVGTPFETEALRRAVVVQLDGYGVRYVSAEDLVVYKIVANRARDLDDAEGILLKNPELDDRYIERWLELLESDVERPLVDVYRRIKRIAAE